MRVLWIIPVLFFFISTTWSIRNVELLMPPLIRAGSSATLLCLYDLEQAPLYSVKWYRGQHEFFRYMPKENPSTKVFQIDGIYVDIYSSNRHQVTLHNIPTFISGEVSCEVTTDSPRISTACVSAQLNVQKMEIDISVKESEYHVGEQLVAKCATSTPAKLAFYINSYKVLSQYVDQTGPTSAVLNFTVSEKEFQGRGDMRLQCSGAISEQYYISSRLVNIRRKLSDNAANNVKAHIGWIFFPVMWQLMATFNADTDWRQRTVPMKTEDSVREVTFPVPWGIIAGKAWGDPCSSPVLLLHGIQDNAGSFDRLIPYLPNNFYYVCLDLPGHGHSSRMPRGFRLDFMDYVLSVNRVVRQLGWSNFILIGHSLGGQLGQYYTAMYPEQVTKLVVLDAYGPAEVPMEEYVDFIKRKHDEVVSLESKILDGEPPSYSYDVALQRMIDNRRSFITRDAAEALVPRNIKKGKNGYYFAPDLRLKLHVTLPLTGAQHRCNYRNIKCPFLLLLTNDMHDFIGVGNAKIEENSHISQFRRNPLFEIKTVQGAHDVHNISPEKVGPIVSEFLLRPKAKL